MPSRRSLLPRLLLRGPGALAAAALVPAALVAQRRPPLPLAAQHAPFTPAPLRCDPGPARARWADQFARRHAVVAAPLPAAPAAVAPTTRRPAPTALRRAVAAPTGARVAKAHRRQRHAATGPGVLAHPAPARAVHLRVAKDAPTPRAACPMRDAAAGALADLDTFAPGTAAGDALGDALGDAVGSPRAGDTPVAGPTVAGAGGDVAALPAPASRGAWSWPRLGWGALALGGFGAAGSARHPGDVPASAPPPGSLTAPLPVPPDAFMPPLAPMLPGSIPTPSAPTPADTTAAPATPASTPPAEGPTTSPDAPPQTPAPALPPPTTPRGGPPDVPGHVPTPDLPTTTVPEPASATLVVAGALVAGGACWRTHRRTRRRTRRR